MEVKEYSYTVGVRSRFWPFYRKFKVFGHQNEALVISTRLVLRLVDGSVIVVPRIENKFVKIFPDYVVAEANLKRLKEEKNAEIGRVLPISRPDIGPATEAG